MHVLNKGVISFTLCIRHYVSVCLSVNLTITATRLYVIWNLRTWYKGGSMYMLGFLFPSRSKMVAIFWVFLQLRSNAWIDSHEIWIFGYLKWSSKASVVIVLTRLLSHDYFHSPLPIVMTFGNYVLGTKMERRVCKGFHFLSISQWRQFCGPCSQLRASSEVHCSQNY